jgi:hypothetical protein
LPGASLDLLNQQIARPAAPWLYSSGVRGLKRGELADEKKTKALSRVYEKLAASRESSNYARGSCPGAFGRGLVNPDSLLFKTNPA